MVRVLFVDDEAIIRESILADFGRMEHPWEYEVHTASSVKEAEKVYDKISPQLVITDVNMPGGSGLLLVEGIKKKNPQCKVMVLSAYDDFEYVRNAFTLGADDYILKPIAFSQLQSQVKKMVEGLSLQEKETKTKQMFALEDVLDYIDTHIADKLPAVDMARRMAVGYNNFGKVFKEQTGKSYSNYVLERRMEQAKEYLSDPTLKIKDVAAKVGYKDDAQHFSRDFTKLYGITPKEFQGRG